MLATKAALASGGITHCCLRCGLRKFFQRPPDRVVAGALDNVQFDDLLLEQAQAPTGETLRGRRECQCDQLCFRRAVENAWTGGIGIVLRVNTASNPSSTSWRLVRSILAMLVSSARG